MNQYICQYITYAFEFLCRSSFAVDGVKCTVNKDVEQSIKGFHAAKKPIG